MSGKSKERSGAFTRSDLILAGSGECIFKTCFVMRIPVCTQHLSQPLIPVFWSSSIFVHVRHRHDRVISSGLQIFQQSGRNFNFLSARRMIQSNVYIDASHFWNELWTSLLSPVFCCVHGNWYTSLYVRGKINCKNYA